MSYSGPYLDDDASFVVAEGNIVGSLLGGDRPHPLQAVIQCALQSVGVGVPDSYGTCRIQTSVVDSVSKQQTWKGGGGVIHIIKKCL